MAKKTKPQILKIPSSALIEVHIAATEGKVYATFELEAKSSLEVVRGLLEDLEDMRAQETSAGSGDPNDSERASVSP